MLAKVAGSFLILAGSGGLGVWYGLQPRKRLFHIREMIRILDMALSEIGYGSSTLPECCERISQKAAAPYDDLFARIHENTLAETGRDFGGQCREVLEEGLEQLPLKGEREIFCTCFGDTGFSDAWMQKRQLERGRQELEGILEQEEQELLKQSGLALRLGTMGGLLLVLLFL